MVLGIGKRIKERREELQLTQMDLAKRLGYTSKAAVCKVERGDDNITADRVSKFAKALNCSEAYLMGWDTNKEDAPLTEEEKEALKTFRNLDEDSQRQLVLMLAFLKDQNNKK